MKRAELEKLREGDKIRMYLINHPIGMTATVTKVFGASIEVTMNSGHPGIPDIVREYSFNLIEKIENGGLNPFIERDENGIDRAKRAMREGK